MEEIEKITSNCLNCGKKPCQTGCSLLNDMADR